jgi:hypothetical protein
MDILLGQGDANPGDRRIPIPRGSRHNAGTSVIPGFAGLGFAFDVETILEVLNLFA